MRIGVAGKGGVGKTTVSAILARTLARKGHQVIAVDCDSDPHLAMNCGVAAERIAAMQPFLERGKTGGAPSQDAAGARPVELLSKYGMAGPDGITLMLAARIAGPGGG